MVKSFVSSVIPTSVDEVWRLVRDFGGVSMWHPGIASSEIEEDRPDAEVGCVRRLVLPGGATMREQLVALDDVERSSVHRCLEGPFAARNYQSTIRVAPVTERVTSSSSGGLLMRSVRPRRPGSERHCLNPSRLGLPV
jgi:hypothetical protein